ncbi:hypothetical protein vseg_016441 [Gypsophila vaccaria]
MSKAWQNDRHQPIRGSFIQLLFRVVIEAHSSAIRNNKEWQEKLPRVVLKAEEIMYSKANSEAEYVDADTLWDRLNDAIDTIIRRDESTETGKFIQPCIEAALVLGCTPVKASRSQRHINTRGYLNPGLQEPAQTSPMISDTVDNNHGPFPQALTPLGNQLSTPRSAMAQQPSTFSLSSQMGPNAKYIANQTSPQNQQSFPQLIPSVVTNTKPYLNLSSIYPLYYSSYFPSVEYPHRLHSSQISNANKIIIGRPIGWPRGCPTCFSSKRNVLIDESIGVAGIKTDHVSPAVSHGKAVGKMDCDLSLRLGPSDCSINSDRHLTKPCAKNLELSFFPKDDAGDPSTSCGNRMQQEVLEKNINLKRKAGDYHELGDTKAQWLLNL